LKSKALRNPSGKGEKLGSLKISPFSEKTFLFDLGSTFLEGEKDGKEGRLISFKDKPQR